MVSKRRFKNCLPYIITILFFISILILSFQHELNTEEIHGWNIVSSHNSFKEFISFMRFEKPTDVSEGHPLLWYLLLYVVNHYIFSNIEGMIILHLLISTATVFLFIKFAPFNYLIKTLFVFGYYQLYNYSILIRNYGIGILFLVLFCTFYKIEFRNIILLGLFLFLMGQTNLFAFIISIIFFIFLMYQIIKHRNKFKPRKYTTLILVNLGFLLLGVLINYWVFYNQIRNNTFGANINTLFDKPLSQYWDSLLIGLKGIIRAFMPINEFNIKFWESNLIINFLDNYNVVFTVLLALLLLLVSTLAIKKKLIPLYLLAVGSLFLIPVFIYTKLFDRHFGHFLYLFIAVLWISRIDKDKGSEFIIKKKFLDLYTNIFLILFLTLSLISSVNSYWYDYKYIFSPEKVVIDYLNKNEKEKDFLVISDKFSIAEAIGGYFNKHSYNSTINKFIKIPPWSRKIEIIDDKKVFKEAINFIGENKNIIIPISKADISMYKKEENFQYGDKYISFVRNYFLSNHKVISNELNLLIYKPYSITELSYNHYYNHLNFENNWIARNDCNIRRIGEKVLLEVYGSDPFLESNFNIGFEEEMPLLLVLDFYSEVEAELEIYFKYRGQDYYDETNSYSYKVSKGDNQICVFVPYIDTLSKIRIDPVNIMSDCIIYNIEIFNILDKVEVLNAK